MDYLLTDDEIAIKELAKKIAEEKILNVAKIYDEEERFPSEIVKILADSGFFALFIPEEYGGLNKGVLDLAIAIEQLSWGCAGIALALAATALATYPIIFFGSEKQKEKYLPNIAKGQLGAFAITEAEAGSDISALQTEAKKENDYYILNGRKQWITNAGEAEFYIIFAKTDKQRGSRGISCFIIEKDTEGLSFGKKEKKLGIRASTTGEVILDNVKVPKENLLGKEGLGFVIAMRTFNAARPGVAAQAIGIAQRALELSIEYAKQRQQFGSPIINFQGIQFLLADMATQLEAARALLYSVCRTIDKKHSENKYDYSKEASMAKLFASDVAMKITEEAVQIFGGCGYMRDYPVEKLMRDAKITQIYEGTNQIQKHIIAQELIKK